VPQGRFDHLMAFVFVRAICKVAICVAVSVALNASAAHTTFSTIVVAELQSEVATVETVKSLEELTVVPFTVTDIFPVVAPDGIVITNCVAVAEETVAAVPFTETVFADAVVLKFVPSIVTVVPTTPLEGVKLVIVGAVALPEVVMVRSADEVTVLPFTVTLMLPVVAPVGTITVRLVAVAAVTVATMPFIVTLFSEAVVLKLVPVMVMEDPTLTLVGEKLVIVGAATSVSGSLRHAVKKIKAHKVIKMAIPSDGIVSFLVVCFI
jgi:hypothetical protein